MSITKAL